MRARSDQVGIYLIFITQDFELFSRSLQKYIPIKTKNVDLWHCFLIYDA